MITWLAGLLLPHVGEKFAKPLAIVALVVLAVGLFAGAKAAYDSDTIRGWLEEANTDFLEQKDEATGKADAEREKAEEEHEERKRTTGELVDEAVEKGCAVGEYLASDGTNCVRE